MTIFADEKKIYDIAIIGGGPAGLTAALYARRASKSVLIIEKAAFGGQMTYSPRIENYPGFTQVSGTELADAMVSQALNFGSDVELDEVSGVSQSDNVFVLSGASGSEYFARSVIIASGAKHRHLGVAREEELTGEGISYCAVCDGDFYSGKNVAVIGGGNSALGDALMLSEHCASVTVIQNLPTLTGEPTLREKIAQKSNISVLYNRTVESFEGEKQLTALIVKNSEDQSVSRIALDGIFVAIGLEPNNYAFEALCALDPAGYILSGEDCRTTCPGIFAAGDCRTKTVRQITTACSDGSAAALAACDFVSKLK